ncbi:MAG: hypothetical protein WC947_06020 [Elusimicrobiota bacterium]
MKLKILFAILLLGLNPVSIFASNKIVSQDANEVITIANKFIEAIKINLDKYKLVEVKNLVISGNDYKGERYWKITYKPRQGINISKGGEIFIEVDIFKKKARLLGYGE